ncbi:3-deoxy-7-phosphoheptulonate synthase [Syntrophobacter fumaroxidans]|uniref:Prephenate dehydratase n=1 Tax=Syntrophobacter fumaroxidans (strain DSM 10017 / MPOB) TaxID=335543 RepID=A0LPP2_SYNFM|nr:3-deoxy-7-phosphoheptulonate synthase [Syntrophobacter fumaroxidans]ABK19394.1 prephenate dehydratase [Syntrophobacter fumaroxidans MPOB]
MILILKKKATAEQMERLKDVLRSEGYLVKEIAGVDEKILGVVGTMYKETAFYESLPGVERAVPISKPYKLVSRELHPAPSVIKVGDVTIGGDRLVVIAGPCGVEDRKRTLDIARTVRKHGAVLFRGGAFKPRTSPYSFQGLGEEGLKILREVREETGLGVVTEITSPSQADLMVKYVDVVQVGARNMQNFELLKSVGRIGKPVLLKRGLSATIEEWLMSAEYVLSEGNDQVILCERGIRTFERYTRNTLDLTAVPVIKKLTHLPIIVDPSHATGIREKVSPMARASIAAGADGLIIEVHTEPDKALSDGPQSLYPEQFEQLMRDLYVIAPVVGKQVDYAYLDKAAIMKPRKGKGKAAPMVVYSGVPGSFSHKACLQFFGTEVPIRECTCFREVFDSVAGEQAAFGVIPVENSLTGSIHENYDLLLEYAIMIVGELTLRIKHNLLGHLDSSIEGIERVYSHPQVFQQCREYLDKHPAWDQIACKDTASAVRKVEEAGDAKEAAIAGVGAVQTRRMTVLKESIETNPRNFTRFVVISKNESLPGPKNKSSLIYSVSDKPGALFETLRIFAENNINLVKLESRPIHSRPWEYLFYADLEVDVTEDGRRHILEGLMSKTEFFKFLGSYQKGTEVSH